MKTLTNIALLLSLLIIPSANAKADFELTITGLGGMTQQQQQAFTSAAAAWESIIVDYKPGVTLTGITINASIVPIDGAGGTLGQAGPTNITQQAGTWYTTTGIMEFDSADVNVLINNGTFGDVILHEMAHVIGFGTLWELNGLYDEMNNPGQYTGAAALAAYQQEWNQQAANFIPVELSGGQGTAHGHWNENLNGNGTTGITNGQGRDFRDELMTGWLNPNSFISNTTGQQFVDLGYVVVTVPEPSSLLALSIISGIALVRRRRR